MKKFYFFLALIPALFLNTLRGQCSLYPVSLSARINNSSVIIEGKIISRKSFWNPSTNYIFTSNLVSVNQVLKGSLNTNRVEIITEGGEIGLQKQVVEPSLQLKQGDEGLFILNSSEQTSQFGSPVFNAYSDAQGFIRFDLDDNTATEPFKKYNDINTELYPALEKELGTNLPDFVNPNPGKYTPSTIASVTGFTPTNITAGTASILTITGAGFGVSQGTSSVEFKNADDGGATFIKPDPSQYVSWSNTQIQVMVPSRSSTVSGTAGTGLVRVTVAGSPTLSAQTLTVDYGEINVYYGPTTTVYQTRHVDLNGSAGITWQMYTSFDANSAAKTAFLSSFQTWRCNTYINWVLGSTTTTNVIAFDGTNVIRFDIGSELPAGVLGRCTSYFNGCISGSTVFWYIAELDICFDEPSTSAITWQFWPSLATGSQYDFESVSLHELGHGHQLTHVINTNDVMHYALANAQNKRSLITQNINAGNDVMSRNVSPGVCSFPAMVALSASICGVSAPTVSFNITSPVCVGQTLTLSDISTYSPTAWSWTMTGGSPASSTLQNTSATFTSAGIYSISLIATNGFGASAVLTKTISVVAIPTVAVSSATICSGTSTLLTATGASSYTWNPGALTGVSQNLSPGSTAVYTVIGDNGTCSGSSTTTITVISTPTLNAPNASICSGSSTLISAGGATSYTWNPGGLGGPSQNLNPGCTTVYTVTGDNGSCTGNPVIFTITVNTTPTLSVPNATICSGTSTLLTAGGATSYTWNPGNLIGASQSLNPPIITVYTVTGATGACTAAVNLTLSVLVSPTITIPNAAICSGASTLLTAGGALSFTWNPGNLVGASQNLSPAATTIYSVNGTIGTCTSSSTSTITVNTTPTVNVPNAVICSGTSTLLTASGAGSYTWIPGSLNGTSQNLNPGSTALYTISGSNGSCISIPVTFTITVNTTPTITVPNAAICSGASTLLTANGATSYLWNPGTLSGTSQNLNPGTTTVYTITGTIGTCTSSSTSTINVTTTPTVSLPSAIICSGSSTLLTASGAASYTWNPGSLSGASQNLNPASTTLYTVSGSNGSCIGIPVTSTITVNSTPTVNIPNASICSGTSTLVTASGATSYLWNPGALSGASQNLNPGTTTVYTITGTIGTCTSSSTSTVNVTTTPTVSVPSASICSGTSTLLTASGAASYTWNPGNLAGTSQNLNPGTTTIYTVTGSIGSCLNSMTTTINVTTTPTLSVANASVCIGSSTLLTASGAASYTWNPGGLIGASQNLNPASLTVYTITGSIGNCSSVRNSTVGLIALPFIFTIASPATVCPTNSATLSGGGGNTYTWSPGGLTGANVIVNPSVSTLYTVSASDGTCIGTSTVLLVVNPNPTVTANSATVCAGKTSTLTAGGATTFTWNPGGLTGPTQNLTPAATTIYTVSGTSGICNDTKTISITVNPNPIISVGNASICSGTSTLMTSSGANTYTWNPGALTGSSQILSPGTTTTYTLVGTFTLTGCTSTAAGIVNVTPTPTLTASVSPSVICFGKTSTLSATGAGAYTWTPGPLTGGTVTVNPAVPTLYSLTGANGACISSLNLVVLVNPDPTVTASGIPGAICSGGNSILTGSGAITYTWNPGNLSGTVVTVIPLSTTIYTVTGTNSVGCAASATTTVFVTPTPTLIVNVPQNVICLGKTLTLTSAGAGSYTWTPGSLSGSIIIVNPAVTTAYQVSGANGPCITTSTFAIVVNPNPTVTVSTSSGTMCSGTTNTLSAFGANSYTWFPLNISGSSVIVSPSATIVYTVTGSLLTGCSSSQSLAIGVIPNPTITATASQTITCSGSSVTLTATGGTSYTWMPGALAGSNVIVNPTNPTLYQVTGISGPCTSQSNIVILTNPNPTLSASPSGSVCSGSSITLTSSGAASFLWNPGNLTGNTVTVSPVVTTIYTVSGSNSTGCVSSRFMTVTVMPTPTLSSSVLPSAVCIGKPSTLTVGGANNYTWAPNSIAGSSIVVTPTTTTVYQVTGVTGSCTSTLQVTLTPNPNPTVTASALSGSMCSGSSNTLSVSGADVFTWNPGSLNGSNVIVSPAVTTIYTVTGSYTTSGCSDTGVAIVNVTPGPTLLITPGSTVFCAGLPFTLTASGAINYTWNPGGLTGPVLTASSPVNTTYSVTGESSGCSTDAVVSVSVTICDEISEASYGSNFKIYPNPANDKVTIDFGGIFTGQITLYNAIGQFLINNQLSETEHFEFNLGSYSEGVYLIKISSNNKKGIFVKLVKE